MQELRSEINKIISNIYCTKGESLSQRASEIIIKNSDAGFSIDIAGLSLNEAQDLKAKAISQISEIPAIGKISIILTSSKPSAGTIPATNPKHLIEKVKKIILVASGKGGVGKSTMAVAFAENLQNQGYRVGLVDADIYGPSIPTMLGITTRPEIKGGKIIPITSRGLQIISIGLLTSNDSPLAWRGPMASKAIYQLLSLSLWDNLDYLVIDMPPGTGDIYLAVLTNYNIDGAVIVTTAQKIAVIDSVKSIELFLKFNIPIIALINNMSYINTDNGRIKIFEQDDTNLLKKYNIANTHEAPLNPLISYASDHGKSLKDLINLPVEKWLGKTHNASYRLSYD